MAYNTSDSDGQPSVTLQDWHVHAMPLVQPGRVLQWPQEAPQTTTADIIASPHRKPFDSMHGGVWRQAGHEAAQVRDVDSTALPPVEQRCHGSTSGSSLRAVSGGWRRARSGAEHGLRRTASSGNATGMRPMISDDSIANGGWLQASSRGLRSEHAHMGVQTPPGVGDRGDDQPVEQERPLRDVKHGQRLRHGPAFYR